MAELQKSFFKPQQRLFLIAALAFCIAPISQAQKVRYGQPPAHAKAGVVYPVQAHIFTVRYREEYVGKGLGLYPGERQTESVAYMDATLNGQKVELRSYLPSKDFPIKPGDYQARPVNAPKSATASSLFGEYEFLMPDHTIWRCTVSGVSG